MRLVLLSDTHNLQQFIAVPDGEVLVHAGDLTMRGTLAEIKAAVDWIAGLPHRAKVVIAGNHDFAFQRTPALARALVPEKIHYLEDSGVMVEGVRFWGSPWQPWFQDWAFNLPRGPDLARRWALIPSDAEVLITHGPPVGLLDQTTAGESVGCQDLGSRIADLAKLKLHVFGHIHEARGIASRGGKTFVNASCCDNRYRPTGEPIVFDLG